MQNKLRLHLFGGFELTTAAGETVDIGAKKARALVAWLALQPGMAHSRDRLSTLLWGESNEQQARHSLRQTLTALRKSSPALASGLEAGHDTVRLARGVIAVDALDLESQVAGAGPRDGDDILALYRGDFLEGLNTRSPAFDEWLMERREHYRSLVFDQLEHIMVDAVSQDRAADAIRIGIRLVALEPLREDIHRALMECYASLGRAPAALQQYRICRAILERELGVAPSSETENVKRRLLSERSRPAVSTGLPAVRSEPLQTPPQLRQITLVGVRPEVLFDHPSPEDEERAMAALQPICESLAERHGLVRPLTVSSGMLLVFGSPRTSTNDSLRALHAAEELRGHAELRIAVASGRAVVSVEQQGEGPGSIKRLSGAVTRQVEAMYDVARASEIIVSDSVRLSCINNIKVTGPLAERLAGDISLWRLDSVDPHRPIRQLPGFVGRQMELGQLTMMLDFCREGDHGHVFMIRGEAGIGKSRLVQKIRHEAALKGDLCIEHNAGPSITGKRSNLIVDCVATLIRSSAAGDEQAVTPDRVTAFLEGYGLNESLVNYARALFEDSGSAHRQAFFASSEPGERDAYGHRLLTTLIPMASKDRPLLMMVEDIHGAGRTLLRRLADIAGVTTQHRVTLIMTSRVEGEPLDPSWRGAMSGAPLTTIDLRPLPPAETRLLAERLAGSGHPKLDDCVARSGGNPLFLEQLLLAADRGSSVLPDSIQSIVEARIDELGTREADAIRAASVLGWRFSIDALLHMLDQRADDIESLMARGLLVSNGSDGRFMHELIHRGIYDSMLLEDRRAHHRKAAEFYETVDPYLHARHVIGGDAEGAETVCVDVATRLRDGYEFDSALDLVELRLRDDPTNARLLSLKANILQSAGATQEAVRFYREALRQTQSPEALMGVADALIVLDRYDEATAYLDALDGLMDAGAGSEVRARSEILKSRIAFAKGYIKRCLEHGGRALEHARGAGLVGLEIESLSTNADARYQQGQMALAREQFDKSYALAMEHAMHQHASINLAMASWTRFYELQTVEAGRGAIRAFELARKAGHRRHQATAALIVAEIAQFMGYNQLSLDYARRAVGISESVGSLRFEIEGTSALGYVECLLGDVESGYEKLSSSAERMVALRPAYAAPWLLAAAARFAPDTKTAAELLHRGERIFEEMTCVSHNYIHFYHYAIDRMLLDGMHDEARRYIEALEAYVADKVVPFSDYCCRRGRVLLEMHTSRRSKARDRRFAELKRETEKLGLKQMAEMLKHW